MIFHVHDTALRFFLQKDIPLDDRAVLEATIREEGGTVVDKVPIHGYVVILSDTPEAARLQHAWRDHERPRRFFVTTSWIEQAKQFGQLPTQVFVKDAFPVPIHIHKSIANVQTRKFLADKIILHGGNPDVTYEDAAVILASKDTEVYKDLRKRMEGNEEKFVEDLKWLDTCIEQRYYYHSPNAIRNLGGRRSGDERIPFTEEDEVNLCNWIASAIPFKESGGRTGNKIYMELASRADRPGYEWVERHTWQSWRERYKKNADRLDQHIAKIVDTGKANGTISQDRSQFGFFKLAEAKHSQTRRNQRKRQRSEEEIEAQVSTRERTSDALETQDSDWAIREGSAPTPAWAQRNAADDAVSESSEHKRQKPDNAAFRTFVLAPATENPSRPPSFTTATEFVADFGQQGPLDIEQQINAIARDQRFLPDEVRAYYLRNHDIVATRLRFERIRSFIDIMP